MTGKECRQQHNFQIQLLDAAVILKNCQATETESVINGLHSKSTPIMDFMFSV